MPGTLWERVRLWAYAGIGTAVVSVGAIVQLQSVERAGLPLLVAFSLLSGLMVLLIVVDTVYHSWRDLGQACPRCGQVRKLKAFRVYMACPGCGE